MILAIVGFVGKRNHLNKLTLDGLLKLGSKKEGRRYLEDE
jgi:hypothetical protein